jgi:calcineurin-like phosphoesterase family protein
LRPRLLRAGVLAAALAAAFCGGSTPTAPPTTPTPIPPTPQPTPNPIPSGPQVFVGAGDIAQCDPTLEPALATGRMLDGIGGTIFTAGDNAYYAASDDDFRNCYQPAWGRHIGRTFPVPGNHEYETFRDAAPYFRYFGSQAGPMAGAGYYSYEVGDWHVLFLNSNYRQGVGVTSNSPQGAWLQADLAAHRNRCTLAIWHHPLFSSGPNGFNSDMRDFWRMLYTAGVEVIVNGHDHLYERFAPQTPDGIRDDAKGIRQFTVGTGGAALYDFVSRAANSERQIKSFGLLKFTLSGDGYQWEFLPLAGGQSDSGSASCH